MLEEFFITCNDENHWTLDATHADDKIIFLRDEYEKFWRKILRGENFALTRCADGERGLMLGHEMDGIDGWTSSEGMTSLGAALLNSLTIDAPNYYYGISCPCCDSAAYYWYLRHVKTSNLTFSNIWLNANFKTFMENFSQLERDAVLITNWRGKGKTFGRLNVLRHYTVSDDCVKFFDTEFDALIRRIIAETGHEKNLLYVVSAGPLSNLIIAALYKNNPDNCYVDFGSATDLMTHERITRPYMIDGTHDALQSCWMFDRKKISIDVDVVLTCYKRPQILRQQLDAVKNQTLAPRRIFLYQDGIDGYFKVELNDKILADFDACKISATNGGVWKRFEFAEEICKSPYVCLFDDDTIPGARWFENCHVNMMQQRGVFVTNGIFLGDAKSYPTGNSFDVGWHFPNKKTCAVDFGGHSWFFERQCLAPMLAKPWRKKYKLVGEDMTLSMAAQELGIGTYVPQHPTQILSLWGSHRELGWTYGLDAAAVHKNPANINLMRQALVEIYANGWRLLIDENPNYFEVIFNLLERNPLLPSKASLQKTFEVGVKKFLPFVGRKPMIFLGELKAAPYVRNLFDLRAQDFHVLDNDCGELDVEQLAEVLRRGAINIFFTDAYDELKPLLEQWDLREGVDFIDGRALLIAVMD